MNKSRSSIDEIESYMNKPAINKLKSVVKKPIRSPAIPLPTDNEVESYMSRSSMNNLKLPVINNKVKPEILTRISKFISSLFTPIKKLTDYENQQLVNFTTDLVHNNPLLLDYSNEQFVLYTAVKFFNLLTNKMDGIYRQPKDLNINNSSSLGSITEFDIHEMLKSIINFTDDVQELGTINVQDIINLTESQYNPMSQLNNVSKFMGQQSLYKFISELSPQARLKKAYICLDSRYAQFSTDFTKLTWSYLENADTQSNSTNVVGVIRNIVSIRMYSIVIGTFASTMQRATILIEELKSQSFISPTSNRRFHFITLINDLTNPIPITERGASRFIATSTPDFQTSGKVELLIGHKFNEGYYHFAQPITTLNTITLSIGDPYNLVPIQKFEYTDCTITTLTYSTTPGVSVINITLSDNHLFLVSLVQRYIYSVFISDFTTSNPASDAFLIGDLNSEEFTAIYTPAQNQIRIYPDQIIQPGAYQFYNTRSLPNLTPVGVMSKVTVQFTTYRVIANMEVTYQDPDITY